MTFEEYLFNWLRFETGEDCCSKCVNNTNSAELCCNFDSYGNIKEKKICHEGIIAYYEKHYANKKP